MNLLTHILQLDPIYWDYYQGHRQNTQLINPFSDNLGHKQFIRNYFHLSGKSILINNFDINFNELKRPSHVTSTFFLGLLIIHGCKVDLKIPHKNLPGYDTLPFIWFLVTLFHDFAENLETQPKFVNDIPNLQALIRHYDISHNLLERKIDHIPPTIFNSISDYFLLRLEENKVDHGIHAGIYLYNALIKNRINKKKNDLNNDLLWDESLDDQYAIAAASIAIHNIWVSQQNLNYEKFGLAVLKDFQGYSILDYPMPYVFGLVDTIDPVKFFAFRKSLSLNNVLNGLSINFSENKIEITNTSLPSELFVEYYKMIRKNLRKWLTHEVYKRNNTIVLQLL